MPNEHPIEDDPIIRRVASVRPLISEDDLSPDSPSARPIADRVLASSTSTPSRAARQRGTRPRWVLPRVGLALAPAAAAIALLVAGTFSG